MKGPRALEKGVLRWTAEQKKVWEETCAKFDRGEATMNELRALEKGVLRWTAEQKKVWEETCAEFDRGKATMNELRVTAGLPPLDEEWANARFYRSPNKQI